MAKVITVAISKGGVGKTTTAVNLAAEFGIHGHRVLLIDMDEQGNATLSATGKDKEEFPGKGVFDMLRAFGISTPNTFISPTLIPNVDVIPTNMLTNQILNQLPILKMQYGHAEYVYLSACLETLKDTYDVIVIDTPPAKNNLTLSALYAADDVIIPVKADKYCMESLTETIAMIDNIKRAEGVEINVLGILLTIVERTALTRSLRDVLIESEYSSLLFKTEIRKAQAVNESTAYMMPVVIYNDKCNPALDYESLYYEIKNKLPEIQIAHRDELQDV